MSENRFQLAARLISENPRASANKIACHPDWQGPPPTAAQMDRVRRWLAAKEEKARPRPKAEWTHRQKVNAWLTLWAVVGLAIIGGLACLIFEFPEECFGVFFGLCVLGLMYAGNVMGDKRRAAIQEAKRPRVNSRMVCPHCQSRGVETRPVERKKGVSGGKAVAAVMTGGVSMLAVGLSREETEMRCHCPNCGTTWHVG
jgi:hypothetical protein